MSDDRGIRQTLTEAGAQQLANITKTPPQWSGITPRWLVSFLPWVPVEAGIYRVNRVKDSYDQIQGDVECSPSEAETLPETSVAYEEHPREYTLNSVTTVLDVWTRISDLYRSPYDQIQQQLRLLIEKVKEKQESELINNASYGLLPSVAPSQRIRTLKGPPTPHDLDELLSRVWKEPAFFLAHPRAIAAFGRECTNRGVPPPTVTLFGTPFITWRGIPLVPSDKVPVVNSGSDPRAGRTSILLLRTGEQKQGVVGLFQPGLPGEVSPSLSVRFMGINANAVASYLISLYCSAAVLTPDALAVLEDVEVGVYNDR